MEITRSFARSGLLKGYAISRALGMARSMAPSSAQVATTAKATDITGTDSTTAETGKTSHVTSFSIYY